ncbi:hypothetical protein F3Y22_tig00013040pilonHSYRG00007 [Hibiscus syriacus]|uniref:Uncharacterized protein n=1 Tax=Hibiscus syriacus TaxID=106335 RepID=A0A6A3C1V3_HIBSY|nr:hypothetical protein F3Y22_tig00013040pilonHSYRG00007 [Hibiscus syriacus]
MLIEVKEREETAKTEIYDLGDLVVATAGHYLVTARIFADVCALHPKRQHAMASQNITNVHSDVDVFNFTDNTWCATIDAPKYMANSHLGVASDRRFIYVVSVVERQTPCDGGQQRKPPHPGLEHWSIAVKDGKALEQNWQPEIPIPSGGPHRNEVVYEGVYMLEGGTTEKHPVNNRMILVVEVFQFHLDSLVVIGKLPYRVKATLAAFWDGY